MVELESRDYLLSLAAKATELSSTLTRQLKDNDIPAPSLAADSPISYTNLTAEIFMTRQALLDVLADMSYVAQGPSESIFNYVHTSMPDIAALNMLNHFNFWSAVPLTGTASLSQIVNHTNLPPEIVSRVLEHAVTLRLFSSTSPGNPDSLFAHTSRSAALAQSPGLRALVSTLLDDAGPPMLVMNQTLEKYVMGKKTLSGDMNETAFRMYHSGEVSGQGYRNSWEFMEHDGEGERKGWRSRNFVEFMRYVKDIFGFEQKVLGALDWADVGDGVVVDIGGSGGHDAFVLARQFPNLNIVVQDLPEVEPVFDKYCPPELADRITFKPHDFFQSQTDPADIYMLKMILHDWPDDECIKILQGLRGGMKKGSRLLFIDYVGKQDSPQSTKSADAKKDSENVAVKTNGHKADDVDSGEQLPRSIRAMGTATDLRMLALFNAKERPVGAWKEIIQKADERYEVVKVEADPLTFFVVIEAVWKGD